MTTMYDLAKDAYAELGIDEDGGVEIDAEAVCLRPGHPRLEVPVLQRVAVDPGVLVGEHGVGGTA